MKVTAQKSMLIGSLKSGMMHITAGEQVEVVKQTEKSYYIIKDGMIKIIPKTQFKQ
jgi:hypothetical protein